MGIANIVEAPREVGALRTRARISAYVVWDHIVQPRAREGEVPWCAEAISAEWLTGVLCAGRPGVRVAAVQAEGGSEGSSVRRRISVSYEGEADDLPTHLFAKTTPSLLTRLSSGMVARREAAFFRDIRAELSVEAPLHYYSGYDAKSGRTLHLFGDLVAAKQARFCNWTSAISRDQANDIVDLLASVHGRFFDSPRFQTDLAWLGHYEQAFRTSERDGAREGHERAMIVAADIIPPDVISRKAEIWPMLERGLEAHRDGPPTLIHSDVHLGNWYITNEDRMGLGDWALICRGHWGRDLAYALSTTLVVEDRRAWERELIERYVARMREHRVEIDFDLAWLRYRQQMFAALIMWTATLCHSPLRPDMQPEEMSREMVRRITYAIADLKSFDSQD